MYVRAGILVSDGDQYVVEVYPESEMEARIMLVLVSELQRRGIVVKKCFSVEKSCWGWAIFVDKESKVLDYLKLPSM